MLRRFTWVVLVSGVGCALLGLCVPAGAQGGEVTLLSPPNGAVFPVPVPAGQITFQWQAYSGAAAYAYWLEDSMGHTIGQDPNPHKVGDTTEVALYWPPTPEKWKWYVMAYSDAGYVNEIARSATWEFEVSLETPTPTPTLPGPTPTPVLPAPVLSAPPNDSKMLVAEYNRTPGLFVWGPVLGASDYRVELVGPAEHGLRTFIVDTTTIAWSEDPPNGYEITREGQMTWRVQGRTAAGLPGAWSEQWTLNLYQPLVESPADVNGDARVDFKDLLVFLRSWQTAEGEPNYNANADIELDGEIEHQDLLGFRWSYLSARRFQ